MIAEIDGGAVAGIMLMLFFLLVVVPLIIASVIFWIWMLVSAVQNKGLTEGEKIGWVLILVFVHVLGAILYFFIGHPKRNTPLPPPPMKPNT
jgi:hypothetical protein